VKFYAIQVWAENLETGERFDQGIWTGVSHSDAAAKDEAETTQFDTRLVGDCVSVSYILANEGIPQGGDDDRRQE